MTRHEELQTALARVSLFDDLPEEELTRLVTGAHLLSLPAGTLIIQQGDVSDAMYVLLEGRLKVFLGNEEGREVILNFLDPGEAFGELALIDGEPRSASIMVIQPARMAMLPRSHFQECLGQSGEMARRLLLMLARRLRGLANQVGSLALMDVYGRVANVLTTLAEDDGQGGRITCELTHQDIASRVGASREMITRILNDLKRGGYISVEQRRIRITQRLPRNW